jgi:hypothetical protein
MIGRWLMPDVRQKVRDWKSAASIIPSKSLAPVNKRRPAAPPDRFDLRGKGVAKAAGSAWKVQPAVIEA